MNPLSFFDHFQYDDSIFYWLPIGIYTITHTIAGRRIASSIYGAREIWVLVPFHNPGCCAERPDWVRFQASTCRRSKTPPKLSTQGTTPLPPPRLLLLLLLLLLPCWMREQPRWYREEQHQAATRSLSCRKHKSSSFLRVILPWWSVRIWSDPLRIQCSMAVFGTILIRQR